MVPDKIYLERVLCSDEVYDSWKKEQTISDDIEYIRKDILIKWAKEKKQQLLEQESVNDEPSDVAAGMNAGFDMIIGKLNSI